MIVTPADTKKIREHVATVHFLHWPRISAEFGVPVHVLKRIAGKMADWRTAQHAHQPE